jgi:hypothetical protein
MCTVVVRVAPGAAWPVTLLALRDESPERPWDPPGAWWPERDPSVRGVHDRSAGGAWLAASDRAGLAVVLNRWEAVPPTEGGWTTRGTIPLDAVVDGVLPAGRPTSRAFNLLRATAAEVSVTAWDGSGVRSTVLEPGVHMLTHGGPDDLSVPRIARWLGAFAADAPQGPPALGPLDELTEVVTGHAAPDDWARWFGILAESAALDPGDPDAILRDHTGPEGRFATLSIVAAAIRPDEVVLRHARLEEPGRLDGSIALRHA